MIEVVPTEPLSQETLDKLRVYAKERLGLEREIPSFSHKLNLRLKRTPKLQMLLDMIREISETNRGITEAGIQGSIWLTQSREF